MFANPALKKIYWKKIYKSDWISEDGYKPIVRSSSETEQSNITSMQKWVAIMAQDPNNQALREIGMGRQVDLLDVTPEERRQIEEGGKQQQESIQVQAVKPQQINPEEATLQAGIQDKLAQLSV